MSHCSFHSFFSGILHSSSNTQSHLIHDTHFTRFLSNPIIIDTIDPTIYLDHQDLSDSPNNTFQRLVFRAITTSNKPGAAFYCNTPTQNITLLDIIINKCVSFASAYIGNRKMKVSCGAFAFIGASALYQNGCISSCRGATNCHSFLISSTLSTESHSGTVKSVILNHNGHTDVTGHSLFMIDNAEGFLDNANISDNHIPKGYSGGFIGWFNNFSKTSFTSFERNIGNSIYGACGREKYQGSVYNWVNAINNTVTKDAVFILLPQKQLFDCVSVMLTKGRILRGVAPVTFNLFFTDSKATEYDIKDDNAIFGYDLKTLKINIISSCGFGGDNRAK